MAAFWTDDPEWQCMGTAATVTLFFQMLLASIARIDPTHCHLGVDCRRACRARPGDDGMLHGGAASNSVFARQAHGKAFSPGEMRHVEILFYSKSL